MIHFSVIRWKNFLSTGNVFTEIQFDRSPSTVIVGENGAGKSTVLDALCFVLFNKPFRNIKKPQLMNTINQKDLVVEIEFRVGTSEYKVVRGIKPNVFEIYKNGTMLDQNGAAKDYQSVLEETILKLNYKSFTQIIVLGSASFTPFMQLPAGHRREVIEDLLDINIFSNMNALLKDRIAQNKNELTEIAYQTELVENKIDVQKQYLRQLQEDIEQQINEYVELIENEENNVIALHGKVNVLSEEVDKILEEIKDKTSVEKKSVKVSELLRKLDSKKKSASKRISFFHENCHCPTCEQEIDDDTKISQIQNANDKLAETEKAITMLEKESENLSTRASEISQRTSDIAAKQTLILGLQSDIQSHNKTVSTYETKIQSLKERSADDTTNVATSAIADLSVELDSINLRKEQLSIDKETYSIASQILKDGGIKTKIIRQYVPIINKLVNKYLAAMDFFVNFELDEEFNEVIKSRGRDDFSYASFSEGEKARIDISLMLTWRAVAKLKNSVNTNLLILDEVFDSSMDANGVEILMGLFNELHDTNIFVISHKGDVLVDKFRSQIKFEKVKSFSRIAN